MTLYNSSYWYINSLTISFLKAGRYSFCMCQLLGLALFCALNSYSILLPGIEPGPPYSAIYRKSGLECKGLGAHSSCAIVDSAMVVSNPNVHSVQIKSILDLANMKSITGIKSTGILTRLNMRKQLREDISQTIVPEFHLSSIRFKAAPNFHQASVPVASNEVTFSLLRANPGPKIH
ncbi:hypothetical protein D9757_009130 [Collybiopsis confluens]|uniref:Uncharacterized protein n=1 Tax=Collybiopsis confluens TaxID=2823264 RepID=A0A8H5H7M6_9AGAR|nr:hypothetical protein D9757_009130 [Collybiopsis confluens]